MRGGALQRGVPNSAPTRLEQLCPLCQGRSLQVRAAATVRYEVVFDADARDFVVLGEHLEDEGWDASSAAVCRRCGWQGTLELCLLER